MKIQIIEEANELIGKIFEVKKQYELFYVFFTGVESLNTRGFLNKDVGIISKSKVKII